MSNVALSLCFLFFITNIHASSLMMDELIDGLSKTLIFSLENEDLIDVNLLFGVAIVAGKM